MVDYSAGSAGVKISPNLTGFKNTLERELGRMDVDFGVNIMPDITGFGRELEAQLGRIDAEFGVDIVPDLTGFSRDLEAELSRIDAEVEVGVTADLTNFERDLQARLDLLSPTIDVTLGIDSALFSARLDVLTRDRTIRVDIDRSGLGGLGGGLGGAGGSLGSLGSSAGSASSGLSTVTMILGAIVTLAPAVIGAIGSIGVGLAGLGTVAGPAAAALGVGLNGVFDAFTAASKSSADAGEDAEAAAKAQRDALRGLGAAQKDYERAVEDEVDAQEDITRARKDAKRQLDDLNLSLKGSALDEKDAVLAIAQAERDLRELGKDGEPVDPLDREAANLRVQQSVQRLAEVQQRNNQIAQDAADANAKGVEGSDQVTDAKDRQADAAARVTDSLQGVRIAQERVNESTEISSTSADAYAEAMAKLSPAAQAFVTQMRSLVGEGGVASVFADSVQEGLFTGIGDSLYNLANTVLPAITPGMTAIANSLGGMVASISDVLAGPAGSQLVTLLESIPTFFTAMQPGIDSTVEGFLAFGDAAAPAMQALGQGMGDFLGMIGDAFVEANKTGALTDAIAGFGDVLSGLGQFMGPLTTMFVELGAVMGPILGDMFASLGQTVTNLLPSFTVMAEVVGNALLTVFQALEPVLPVIFQAFADIFTAVEPLIAPMAELAGVVISAMATNLSSLAIALAPVIEALADSLMPLIPILAQHFATLTPIFADVALVIGQALADAVIQLAPLLPEMMQAFSDLIVAVVPLLPVFADLAAQWIPLVAGALVALAPFVVDILNKFADFVNFVVPIVIPMLQSLEGPIAAVGDYFSAMGEIVSTIWNGVVETIKFAVRAVGGLLARLPDTEINVGPVKIDFGDVKSLGQQMQDWANSQPVAGTAMPAQGAGTKGASGAQPIYRAEGGATVGPGGPTQDMVAMFASPHEHVLDHHDVNALGGQEGTYRFRAALKEGKVGNYAIGGEVQWGSNPAARSIYDAAVGKFGEDGVTVTSALRPGDSGHHGTGTAVDLVGPNMQAIADYFYSSFPNLAQLIWGPGPLLYNDRGTKIDPADQAQLQQVYAGDLAGHFDHVHLANNEPIGAAGGGTPPPSTSVSYGGYGAYDPQAGGQQYQSAYNSSAPGDYSSPYMSGGQGAQSKALPEKLSAQAIGAKAGTIVANGILSFFGLENSILSENNPYNQVVNQGIEAYSERSGQSTTGSTPTPYTSGTAYAAPNFDYGQGATTSTDPAAFNAPVSGGHTYQPGGGAMQWRPTVLSILAATGRSADLAPRTLDQIDIESGGDPGIINDWDSNAAAGHPSAGLLQMIIGTYNAHIDPRYPSINPVNPEYPQTDPESNIASALNYADDEYGGPQNIWPKTMGYATGGWIKGMGGPRDDLALLRGSPGEFMVKADRAAAAGPLLEMINGDRAWSTPNAMLGGADLSSSSSQSTVVDQSINYGDVQTMDVDQLFERQERDVMRRNLATFAGRN